MRLFGDTGNHSFEFRVEGHVSGSVRLFGNEGFDTLNIFRNAEITDRNREDTVLAFGIERIEIETGAYFTTLTFDDTTIVGQQSHGSTLTLAGQNNRVFLNDGTNAVTLSGINHSVVFGTGDDRALLSGDGYTVSMRDGNDRVELARSAEGNTVTTGGGNEIAVIFGDNTTLNTGGGQDTVTLNFASESTSLNTGAGADTILASAQSAAITSDDGNDMITVGGAGFFATDTTVRAGNGADTINVLWGTTAVHGGNGADTLRFSHTRQEGIIEASGGSGADTFIFRDIATDAVIQINDFVVGVDQLLIDEIISLADLTSLTQNAFGAVLNFDLGFTRGSNFGTSEITVILEGLLSSNLTDDIFG